MFNVSPGAAVVTTKHVTLERKPVLEVSHMADEDDEEGALWQFHCGNGDYHPSVLQLVRLDEILRLDPGLVAVADLPIGFKATRATPDAPWVYEVDDIEASE